MVKICRFIIGMHSGEMNFKISKPTFDVLTDAYSNTRRQLFNHNNMFQALITGSAVFGSGDTTLVVNFPDLGYVPYVWWKATEPGDAYYFDTASRIRVTSSGGKIAPTISSLTSSSVTFSRVSSSNSRHTVNRVYYVITRGDV